MFIAHLNRTYQFMKTYVKRWLHLHQGANFRHLYLPIKKFGMKFFLPSDIYRFCQLSKRNTLKKFLNDEIKELYKLTVQKHHSDKRLLAIETTQKPKVRLNKEIIEGIVKDFSNLKEQNAIINSLHKLCDVATIICWQVCANGYQRTFSPLQKKALVFSLPNKSNLKRRRKSQSDKCNLCKQKQT